MRNKIFLLIMSLLVTCVIILLFVTYQIQKSTINTLAKDHLNEKSTEKEKYFDDFISHKKILLSSLTLNKDFINFIKNKEGKEIIENIFLSYAHTHKEIFQFRYIDIHGNEIIRVENYSKVNLVQKNKLQNKKSRYYFTDTVNLNKNEYFFSNIDLNIEHKKIQKPIIPTIRIATPVIIENIKYGIVIININIKEFLEYLQKNELYYINLIYDDCKVIVTKNEKYNWSRDFKLKNDCFSIFPNLPKDFYKSDLIKTENLYIKKLNINTNNKIYMILLPKELGIYDLLYEDLNQNLIFLIFLILICIPISYCIAKYVENSYKKKLSIKKELKKLRMVIEHAPISIVITDKKGDIEYVNPYFSEITGYSHNEVIGLNPKVLKSNLTSDKEYKKMWDTLLCNQIWKGTFKNITKEGKEFWETALITPILDKKNKPCNFLAIKQEITKEVYLKEELENKEKLMIAQSRHATIGEMISMIAHQWRQPLSIISMVTSNTLMDIEFQTVKNDILKEQSESILKQVDYLSQTIDDFRDFFKPNKAKILTDPKKVLDETLSIMGKTLEKNCIKIKVKIQHTSKVEIYSRELLQVLINLVKNSKEALENNDEKNREIKISTSEEKNKIRIEISDNAGGIEESLLDKIFEPYISTKDEKTGTGLGLYMSKTIIEKHFDGIFGVYNDKKGACFYIDLPINQVEKN